MIGVSQIFLSQVLRLCLRKHVPWGVVLNSVMFLNCAFVNIILNIILHMLN